MKAAYKKAMIGPRYKVIIDNETESVEMYDLNADPDERVNVVWDNEALAQTMLERVKSWLSESRAGAPEVDEVELTPVQLERLRNLGYIAD